MPMSTFRSAAAEQPLPNLACHSHGLRQSPKPSASLTFHCLQSGCACRPATHHKSIRHTDGCSLCRSLQKQLESPPVCLCRPQLACMQKSLHDSPPLAALLAVSHACVLCTSCNGCRRYVLGMQIRELTNTIANERMSHRSLTDLKVRFPAPCTDPCFSMGALSGQLLHGTSRHACAIWTSLPCLKSMFDRNFSVASTVMLELESYQLKHSLTAKNISLPRIEESTQTECSRCHRSKHQQH